MMYYQKQASNATSSTQLDRLMRDVKMKTMLGLSKIVVRNACIMASIGIVLFKLDIIQGARLSFGSVPVPHPDIIVDDSTGNSPWGFYTNKYGDN